VIETQAELTWRKSSYSGPRDVCCVEIAFAGADTAVRDSKNPAGGSLLVGAGVLTAGLKRATS